MKYRGNLSSPGPLAAIALVLVLAIGATPGVAAAQGPGEWTEYAGNPIIDPADVDAYYPSVLYDDAATAFGSHGQTSPFKMGHHRISQHRLSVLALRPERVNNATPATTAGGDDTGTGAS